MSAIVESLPFLLKGLGYTMLLSICSVLISIFFGVIIGICRTLNQSIIRFLCKVFIDVFRGLPTLVVLFIVFFFLPEFGLYLPNFMSALIGLSLWAIANVAEAVRGAIQSIPKAQTEVSYALGLNYLRSMIYVIIPQATRRVIPSIIGILTNLIHSTSLTVLIGNVEFLKSAQITIERLTMMGIESSIVFIIYALVLLGYFIICYPLSLWSKNLERRLKV